MMEEPPFSFGPFESEMAGRLHETRTLILSGKLNQQTTARVTAQLTTLAAESEAPINVVVSAWKGSLESGLALYDAIRYAGPRVRMLGSGRVGSAGILVLAAIPMEDRYALPNARFLLQHPSDDEAEAGSDILDRAEQVAQLREQVYRLLARQTEQPLERIEEDIRRGRWLTAEEAVEYGLVSRVVARASEVF